MPRPAHRLTTFSGVFGSAAAPIEEWSFGLRTVGPATLNKTQLDAVRTNMANAYANHILPLMGSNIVMTKVRTAQITAAGAYAKDTDGSFLFAEQAYNAAGTQGATNMPTQVAIALSLITPRAGAVGRGRIFLPWPSHETGLDGLLTVQFAEDLAEAGAAFIGAASTFDEVVSVVSTTGVVSAVTQVRVGRVPDTQRSRRNRRDEGYISALVS